MKPDISIALIEDDHDLRESLYECLTVSGYRVLAASSALDFYRLLVNHSFDIVVADIQLPDEDGFSIARFLRANQPETGVIMLTAKAAIDDRVRGYESGADIYLVKPVEYQELDAAIVSLLRRVTRPAQQAASAAGVPVSHLWTFERDTLCLHAPNGTSLNVTGREARLISVLASSIKEVVSREDVMSALEYTDDPHGQRSLNAVVVRLRAKVEQTTSLSLPLQTIRGQGYVLHDLQTKLSIDKQ